MRYEFEFDFDLFYSSDLIFDRNNPFSGQITKNLLIKEPEKSQEDSENTTLKRRRRRVRALAKVWLLVLILLMVTNNLNFRYFLISNHQIQQTNLLPIPSTQQ